MPGGRDPGPLEPAVASHSRETPGPAPSSGSPLDSALMSRTGRTNREQVDECQEANCRRVHFNYVGPPRKIALSCPGRSRRLRRREPGPRDDTVGGSKDDIELR